MAKYFFLFFFIATNTYAQPTLPPFRMEYNTTNPQVCLVGDVQSPLTGSVSNNVCSIQLGNSGVTANTYQLASITVNAQGLITGANSNAVTPAFNIFIDVNGTNSTTCGTLTNPCRSATGTNGAIQKILNSNDNGATTCTTDTDSGCMRCSGTNTKCNANPPWDSDCTYGTQICSAYTCAADNTKGCGFFCTTANTTACIYDADCPNRDTCNSAGACTGTKKCNGGANLGVSCSVDSQCPGASCAGTTCTGGSRPGGACVFSSDCATNSCGGTDYCTIITQNPLCPAGEYCSSPGKKYQLVYSAGNFNDYFDNSDATHTIPPGMGGTSVSLRGAGRGATTLYGTVNSGAHYDLTNKGGAFYDLSLDCRGTAPCVGSTGDGPFTMQNTSVIYKNNNIGVSETGYGNRYNTWENSWIYGPNGSMEAMYFENYGPFYCSNDGTKQCMQNGTFGDAYCGGGTGSCTPRTCSNNHSLFCIDDTGCTGGGKCKATAASTLFEFQGSDELYMDKMLIQPGCKTTGATQTAALEYKGIGTGSSYFNNRIINSTLYADSTAACGTTVTGLKLSRTGSCGGNGGGSATCPSTSPEIEIQGLHFTNDTNPYDVALNIGSSTKLIVQDMDYDACKRTIAGIVSYTDGSSNHRWGGGENDLGELYCSAPPNPQNGETWTYSGQQYIQNAGSTYTMATITGNEVLTNKTLTAPTIGDFTNAPHSHQSALGGGDLRTGSGAFWFRAGVSGNTTALLSSSGTGALTLASGGGNNGTYYGGATAAAHLILGSNPTATKGKIYLGDALSSYYDEGTAKLTINSGGSGTTVLDVGGDGTVNGTFLVSSPGDSNANAVLNRTATQTVTNKTMAGADGGASTTRGANSNTITARLSATDCTANTDGKFGELCLDKDDGRMWVCTASTCNASGWEDVNAHAANYIYSPTGTGNVLGISTSAMGASWSNLAMRCYRWVPTYTIQGVTKVDLIQTAAGSGTQRCGVAVYSDSNSGAQVLLASTISASTSANQIISKGGLTAANFLEGIPYRVCACCSATTTVPALETVSASQNMLSLMGSDAAFPVVSSAANACTGNSIPPSTTGTLTTSTTLMPPIVKFLAE